MERVILHCDLNCFFASVELLEHPELRQVPTAVCGDPASRHGIILAKNEAAKRYGVVTAETIWQARKKCPGLVLLPPHRERYTYYSRKVNEIYGHYTDLVEPFGIDESWLDITGSMNLFGGDPKAIADRIRRQVREDTGLTLSVGVSFNKVFAKLGSDYRKPDATTVIPPEGWQDIVWPLPVDALLFVGRSVKRVLAGYGVQTIGDLARCKPEMLETLLGKNGLQLYEYANGLDRSPVRPQHQHEPVKSVGNGTTFTHDLTSWDAVRTEISLLSDSVAMRLRQQGLFCSGLSVAIKNNQFKTVSRQMQLPAPTHLIRDIYQAALTLTGHLWKPPSPIRMITVTALYLTDSTASWQQMDLLGTPPEKNEKREKLESAMSAIRGKYGKSAIAFGKAANADGHQKLEDDS